MFLPLRFKTSVQLSPVELDENLNETIKNKLKSNLEGVCSRFGYIKPGSLDIIKRSVGTLIKEHFNGHIRFEVNCRGDVCNPPENMVVQAIVKNKNGLGLLAESSIEINGESLPILEIIIPKKSNGISSEIDLDEVQIGDNIYVMVMGKRSMLNDKKISIIGCAVKAPKAKVVAASEEDDITVAHEITAIEDDGIYDEEDDEYEDDDDKKKEEEEDEEEELEEPFEEDDIDDADDYFSDGGADADGY